MKRDTFQVGGHGAQGLCGRGRFAGAVYPRRSHNIRTDAVSAIRGTRGVVYEESPGGVDRLQLCEDGVHFILLGMMLGIRAPQIPQIGDHLVGAGSGKYHTADPDRDLARQREVVKQIRFDLGERLNEMAEVLPMHRVRRDADAKRRSLLGWRHTIALTS